MRFWEMFEAMSSENLREKIVLITGSRNYNDYEFLERKILESRPDKLIFGDANGADSMAKDVAEKYDIPYKEYEAQWERYGKKAGPVRNWTMLKSNDISIVLAFFWKGRSPGTSDMVQKAKREDCPVREYMRGNE